MKAMDVQLIGVFDPEQNHESFCYTVDLPAPANLWVGALCEDGTRMHPLFMGFVLNSLIEEDKWNEGDYVLVVDQSDVTLRATVTHLMPKRSVEAFAAETDTVRVVVVGPDFIEASETDGVESAVPGNSDVDAERPAGDGGGGLLDPLVAVA